MKYLKCSVKFSVLLILLLSLSACFDDDEGPIAVDIPENRTPVASNVDFTTQTEVAIQDNLIASDPDGDTLTFSIDEMPLLGEIMLNTDGSFIYQPSIETVGNDSFSFTVQDSRGGSARGQVNIVIEALELSFTQSVRGSFQAENSDAPQRVNGRVFIQDASSPTEFQDLLDGN